MKSQPGVIKTTDTEKIADWKTLIYIKKYSYKLINLSEVNPYESRVLPQSG
jgi:hypothetical protein